MNAELAKLHYGFNWKHVLWSDETWILQQKNPTSCPLLSMVEDL